MNAFRAQQPDQVQPLTTYGDPMASRKPNYFATAGAVAEPVSRGPNGGSSTGAAPTPARTMPNAFMAQPAPKAEPNPVANAFKAFATGLVGPERIQAIDDQHKANAQEKLKKTLAWVEQTAAIPADQREQWTMANADAIMQDTGQDPRAMSRNAFAGQGGAGMYSDEALAQARAAISAQLGMVPEKPAGPDYQFLQGPDGAIARGDKTSGGLVQLQPGAPKPADPVKMEQFIDATGQLWDRNPYTGESRKAEGMRARVPGADGGDSAGMYRPATAAEKEAFGVPPEVALTINTKTGKPDVLLNPKATSLYTPTEEKNFRGKAGALGTLKFLTDEYRSLVNQYGPGLFDGKMEGTEWKKTPEGQKLLASHNNLMMFLKGPELFNLGVLTGPDVERLQRTLPEPVGMGAFGQSKETLGIGLDSLDQLVGYQMGMVPEEFRVNQPQQPSQSQGAGMVGAGAGLLAAQGARPQQAQRPAVQPQASPQQAPVQIADDDDFDALPSGAAFIGPDGIQRVKP